MLSLARLVQVELGAPPDHLLAEVEVLLQGRLQVDDPWLPVDQRQHVDREGGLHGGVLVEGVEHLARLPGPAQLDDDAHTVAVRFVPQVADAVDLLVAGEGGDPFDEGGLVHLVGQLCNDDLHPVAPR